MDVVLREALRRLCAELGWSYAIFWNAIRCGKSSHLVWAEGYHEAHEASAVSSATAVTGLEESLLNEYRGFQRAADDANTLPEGTSRADKVGVLVNKMRSHVHVVGEGAVGHAALTGEHQWIIQSCENYVSEGFTEMNHQFSAGIKTIAIVPVLPHGVVQLGSVQAVMENVALIQLVRQYFLQLSFMRGVLLSRNVLKDLDLKNKAARIAPSNSLYSSGTACSNMSNLLSFNTEDSVPVVNKFPIVSPLMQSSCVPRGSFFDKASLRSTPATTIVDMPTHGCSNQTAVPAAPFTKDLQLQKKQMHGSSYSCQSQSSLVASTLTSSTGSYHEVQLLSDINNHGFLDSVPALETTKTVQQHHGKAISSSPNDLVLPGHNDESSYKRNNFAMSGIQGSMERNTGFRYVNSFATAAAQVASNMNCSTGHSASVIASESTDKHTDSMSTITMSNVVNDPFQSFDNVCMDQKVSRLLHRPSTSNVQDCWLTCSNPINNDGGYGNYPCLGGYDFSLGDEQKVIEHSSLHMIGQWPLDECIPQTSSDDLFDVLGVDFKSKHWSRGFDGCSVGTNGLNTKDSVKDTPTCISKLEANPCFDAMHDGVSNSHGILLGAGPDQLLDAVVSNINSCAEQRSDDLYCRTATAKTNTSVVHINSSEFGWATLQQQMHGEHSGHSLPVSKAELSASSVKSSGSVGKTGECSQKDAYKSQISLWAENGHSMKFDGMLSAQCKRIDEIGKLNRKRSRPGESPRPRPKDRQMIQDRVKELREIVPNGAKCSIDALLERTIKHMLFLQSVTKHADKLKETGEPKIISKEGGLLLKDNFEGGATWAFEVGTRSMVCPIIVEDLKPPRQLLVEMLCKERGFFLEIADLIRGLGLTILKGVMEARNDKVWARFAVEANRDVTRMDIFMSLVRLLEPNAGGSIAAQSFDNSNIPCNVVCQSSVPATGLANQLL